MSRFLISLSVTISVLSAYSPAFGEGGGFVGQEYLFDISSIDPRDENALDFLGEEDRKDYAALALEAYTARDFESSARYHLLSLQDKRDPVIIYYLACNYALMGEVELASRTLKYAVEAGYHNLNHIERDGDFDGIRDSEAFKRAMAEATAIVEALPDEEDNRLYFEGKGYCPAKVVLPDGYDPDKAYPVLVALHGGAHGPDSILEMRDMFVDPDFIFVALQAQNPIIWEGKLGYNWIYRDTSDRDIQLRAIELAEEYIMDSVAVIRERYKTDAIYLTGFSEGGGMTYIAGIKHPDIFAGIVPISGFMVQSVLTDEVIAAGSALPVYIIHGTSDSGVPYERSETAIEKLKTAGYRVELFSHGGGHELNEESVKQAQIWLGL